MTNPTSHYAGVTAYIQNDTDHTAQLRVLAEAIPAFAPFADMTQPVAAKFQDFIESPNFRYIKMDAEALAAQNADFPYGTPDELKAASITEVVIKGQPMLRLYVPITGDDDIKVETVAEGAMRILLFAIFAERLVTIKNRYASHLRPFAEATTHIVVRAEKALA